MCDVAEAEGTRELGLGGDTQRDRGTNRPSHRQQPVGIPVTERLRPRGHQDGPQNARILPLIERTEPWEHD